MKMYAHMEFTDENGKHEVGEEVWSPRDTDQEKATHDRLIEMGVIHKDPPAAPEGEAEEGNPRRRSRA